MTLRSCDTMVALPNATKHGQTLFAKNSDRSASERQPLCLHARRTHAPGATTRASSSNCWKPAKPTGIREGVGG